MPAWSRGAGLAPVDVHRRATEASLPELAPLPDPQPMVIVAPTIPPAAPEPSPASGEAVQ